MQLSQPVCSMVLANPSSPLFGSLSTTCDRCDLGLKPQPSTATGLLSTIPPWFTLPNQPTPAPICGIGPTEQTPQLPRALTLGLPNTQDWLLPHLLCAPILMSSTFLSSPRLSFSIPHWISAHPYPSALFDSTIPRAQLCGRGAHRRCWLRRLPNFTFGND